MLQTLSKNFKKIFDIKKKNDKFNKINVINILKEIKISLLKAEIAYSIIKRIIYQIKKKYINILSNNISSSLEILIELTQKELINILENKKQKLSNRTYNSKKVLLLGLQGVGKTNTAVKLAIFLKKRYQKRILLTSLDIFRPFAQEQLKILTYKTQIITTPIINYETSITITKKSLRYFGYLVFDTIIYDTAGRVYNNSNLLNELKNIHRKIKPEETLLIADSLAGQETLISARNFNKIININNIIITRTDGESKGGIILSLKEIVGKSIKYMTNGENISNILQFHPIKISSKILDKESMFFLIKKTSKTKLNSSNKVFSRIIKGNFNLEDYKSQLKIIKQIGGVKQILETLNSFKILKQHKQPNLMNTYEIKIQLAIINSMNKKEKNNPKIISFARKRKIANGSGTQVRDINKLVKTFYNMKSIIQTRIMEGKKYC